jgi:poly(hydroxyalkanoate) depolymerase family esterase
MTSHERWVADLLDAVQASRGRDPLAATDIIQNALRGAGLLGAVPAPADGTQATTTGFVDLNAPPAWTRTKGQARPADAPAQGAKARDWAARFMPKVPTNCQPHGQTTAFDIVSDEAGTATGAPGRVLRGSFDGAAGTRRYRLYVPASASAGPRPLVVMLHGCKQNPDDFAAGTRMDALAEAHGCLVLYPEQAASANHSGCWNWFETGHQGRDAGEPSLIAGMTRTVMREHGVDPDRVYVAGLSAGGAMAAVLGAVYPDLFRAIGVHSGLAAGSASDLMSGLQAMKRAPTGRRSATRAGAPVPTIVFHGDRDAVVHPSNGQAVTQQFAPASSRQVEERGERHTRTLTLDGEGRTVAEHWTLHGAGHAWSGGSPAGSYTDPSGPDASAEMLRFFLAQPPR